MQLITMGSMSTQKVSTGKRVGLNREAIVAKALEITAREGLDGWSMRELSSELGVVNSVLYHYFSSKDDLCDAVVDHVLRKIDLPDENLEWKAWFTALLHSARPVLTTYPGVVDRFKLGRYTSTIIPCVDLACQKLLEAGFGVLAPLALSMIANVTIQTISARNMRIPGHNASSQDVEGMLNHFSVMAQSSPGMALMVHGLFEHLIDSENEQAVSNAYFDLIVASLLDGLENVMIPQAEQAAQAFPCCDGTINSRTSSPDETAP